MKDAFSTLVIITITMFSHTVHLVAQNTRAIDSFKTVIVKQKDIPQKVDSLLSVAQEFAHSNADSCFFYLDKAIELATRINYKTGLGEAYFMQSYSYDVLGNYPQSISSLEKSIELFVETKDSSYLSGCYNNLGVLYSYGSEQKKSLEYFIKSINMGEALRDSFSLAEAYSNVAGFYEDRNEYSSALKYYKKALEIDKLYNYPEDVAISEVDVGYMNIKLLRYDEALKNLERARELMTEVDDPYYKTVVLQRFANYYKETGELSLAENEITKAQQLIDVHDYPMLTVETLGAKAEILLAQEQYSAAVLVIDEAIHLSEEIDSKSILPDLYERKAEALFGLGSYKKGHDNLQVAKQFKDALRANEVAEYLSEFETQEALKEERARLLLEQELENQRNEFQLIKMRSKLYFTIVLAVFLGLLMSIALYLFILKQNHAKKFESNFALINHQKELIEKNYYELKENEKRLSKLNATKDKFFSIIAHDLKNPFNTLIGVSEIMLIDPDVKNSDDFDDFVKGMHETAKSGYDLLDNLLQWSRSQIGSIQFEPKTIAIDKTISHVSSMFKEVCKAKNITISRLGERNREVYADENMLNFILRNLINNAIKYSTKNEEIEVDTYNEKENTVFRVIDYGIGMSEKTIAKLFKIEHSVQCPGTANEKGTGLGLILCKEFVEKNGGEIWVESREGEGSIFHFSLPQAPSS